MQNRFHILRRIQTGPPDLDSERAEASADSGVVVKKDWHGLAMSVIAGRRQSEEIRQRTWCVRLSACGRFKSVDP